MSWWQGWSSNWGWEGDTAENQGWWTNQGEEPAEAPSLAEAVAEAQAPAPTAPPEAKAKAPAVKAPETPAVAVKSPETPAVKAPQTPAMAPAVKATEAKAPQAQAKAPEAQHPPPQAQQLPPAEPAGAASKAEAQPRWGKATSPPAGGWTATAASQTPASGSKGRGKMQPHNSSQGGLWAKEFREKLRAIHEGLAPECTWQTFQAGWQEACVNLVQLKLHPEARHPGKVL